MKHKHPIHRQKSKPAIYLGALFLATTCTSFAAFLHTDKFFVQTPATQAAAPQAAVPTPAAKLQMTMTQGQAKYIVRTSLKSLHDALRTGNFTVLRDLAGPSMQAKYSAAQLFQHFEAFANKGQDLTHISMLEPVLTGAQVISGSDMVRLDGYVAGELANVGFAIVFESTKGRWALADFVLESRPIEVAAVSDNQLIVAPR